MAQDITLKLTPEEKRWLKLQLNNFQKNLAAAMNDPEHKDKVDDLRNLEKVNYSILRKLF